MSFAWRQGGLAVEGSSRAGDRSWFRISPPGIAFDVGRGAPELAGISDIFITHGHLDHALGLPYVLSQHGVHGERAARVYCPAAIADDLRAFILAAMRLERVEYRFELVGLSPGERVRLNADLAVEAFAVDHVVPALGYHLVRERRRLLPALGGLPGPELAARRARGETIDERYEELWLSYCGDTTLAAFDIEPRLCDSRVLLLECTFLDPAKRDSATRYKHVHAEDLPGLAPRLRNETILLTHLSRRHRPEELRRFIDEHAPEIAARTVLLVDDPV